jgi:Cu/Ag efflux protein CusF
VNIKTFKALVIPLLGSILISNSASSGDDSSSPLDVDQHPTSPTYESLFPDTVVPLDTRLSWKQRFLGNETFNADQSLPETSPVIESLSRQSADEAGPGGFDASGVVRQVKTSEGKVKVEHGPIDRLGMPAMTMMFRVEDPTQLTGLKKGTEIDFDVDNSSAGFAITRLTMKATRFDASGVIKQVKLSEGKIKVEHGPIDRLGMPAMTMMFRVEDPAQLTGLEKGTEIDFDVDNTSAGFAITRLAMKATGFDASGVVKQVRAAESKLKIQHGPIDKLGMPGMTMLFKVRDPQQLAGLERDMPIEFDVVNEGSGFEITRLRATNTTAMQSAAGPACYRVGPFTTHDQALAMARHYNNSGGATRIVSDSERQYVGSLVYVDGHATREQALASAETLKANGILDYVILDEGDKRNLLSLGVFSDQANAGRLVAKVEAMDLPVKTEAFYRNRSLDWLLVEMPGGAGLPQAPGPDQTESEITRIPQDCNL